MPEIPLEVVANIISWLPISALDDWGFHRSNPDARHTFYVAMVCRSWLPLVINHLYSVCTIDLERPNRIDNWIQTVQQVVLRIEKYGIRPHTVRWTNVEGQAIDPAIDMDLDTCHSLAELSEKYMIAHKVPIRPFTIGLTTLLNLFEQVPKLQKHFVGITFRFIPAEADNLYTEAVEDLTNLVQSLENTKRLGIDYFNVDDWEDSSPWPQLKAALTMPLYRNNLTELQLGCVTFSREEDLCMLLADLPRLESVEIEYVSVLDEQSSKLEDSVLLSYGPSPPLRHIKTPVHNMARTLARAIQILCRWITFSTSSSSNGILESARIMESSEELSMLRRCGSRSLTSLLITVGQRFADLSKLSALRSLSLTNEAPQLYGISDTWVVSFMAAIDTLNTVQGVQLTHLSVTLKRPSPHQWSLFREALDRPCFHGLVDLHITVVLDKGMNPDGGLFHEMDILADLPVIGFRRTVKQI